MEDLETRGRAERYGILVQHQSPFSPRCWDGTGLSLESWLWLQTYRACHGATLISTPLVRPWRLLDHLSPLRCRSDQGRTGSCSLRLRIVPDLAPTSYLDR